MVNQNEHDSPKKSEANARNRLLDAAEELFAKKGFDSTSSRAITRRAECNVAAINYYFGGKDNLYIEVFSHRMKQMRDIRIESINRVMEDGSGNISLSGLLDVFARAFLEPFVDEQNGPRLMKLMVREMLDSRLRRGMFFEETILPVLTVLQRAVSEICPDMEQDKIVQCMQSVVAQLLHTVFAQEMIANAGNVEPLIFDVDRTVDHIVAFSTAGISCYAKHSDGKRDV